MIGAVVGVQPFGGEGLSGTGPKAGGPLYLTRLVRGYCADAREWGGVRCESSNSKHPDLLSQLFDWIRDSDKFNAASRDALLMHCMEMREMTLAGVELELPGPTGERNTLSYAAKGEVLLIADNRDALIRQLAAAFATGNHALVTGNDVNRELCSIVPHSLHRAVEMRGRQHDWQGVAFDALLFEGSVEEANRIRIRLAARDGAIVPLIPVWTGHYPLQRLVVERAVSINTAAAGGNATLMRLA
jgi:RHH-type proline utilization regulon transcriptional repressor/proline dehydrogenase/delta 1-pyrroline-5-carboxylate dehydrogenase